MRITTLFVCAIVFFSSCAKPIAKFAVQQEENKVPATVNFENQSEKADSYIWEFGDGETSTAESPEHRYYLSGKYNVVLKAKKGSKESKISQEIIFDAPEICLVEMQTSEGTMLIQLFDETPKHRDNFLKLAEQDFYNNLLFHRVIDGFMIQGGDPESKNAKAGGNLGSGGPGYTIEAEFNPDLVHVAGALAAARQGDNMNPEKRSSGSQFYIVHGKPVKEDRLKAIGERAGITYSPDIVKQYLQNGGTPFLDNNYTVFGKVVNGISVIDKIAKVKKDPRDSPLEYVKIISVKVIK